VDSCVQKGIPYLSAESLTLKIGKQGLQDMRHQAELGDEV
jgi:hypothetical protein